MTKKAKADYYSNLFDEVNSAAAYWRLLEILDIFQVNTLVTAKFMFRYHNNLLPPLFRNLFMTNSQVHRYDTRTVHSCQTNIKKFT